MKKSKEQNPKIVVTPKIKVLLDKHKLVESETYASVVQRMIDSFIKEND